MSKFLNIRQIAEYLNCSVPTIHRWRSNLKFPSLSVGKGKKLLFETEKVEKWLRDRNKEAKKQLKENRNGS